MAVAAQIPVKTADPIKGKKVPVAKGKVAGFLDFGSDNRFPQKLIEACNESVTAKACLKARARFIQGNGFTSDALANFIINRQGQTADFVLNRTAWNIAQGEVITLHIGYNGLGQINAVRPAPFEIVRLGMPDDLGFISHAGTFPYIDSDIKKGKDKDHTRYNIFNPDPEVVLEQIAKTKGGIDNYPGQLIYHTFWAPGDGHYHIPGCFTAITDIESERELSTYDFRTIINSFSGSGIAAMLDDSSDESDDEDDEISDAQSLVSQFSAAMGSKEAGALLFAKFKSIEALQAFRFISTTGADLANRYNSTNGRVPERITRAFETPNELANIRRSGGVLFSAEELKMASQLMQQVVNPYQRGIEQLFRTIFQHWHKPVPFTDFSIQNLNYFPDDDDVTVAG